MFNWMRWFPHPGYGKCGGKNRDCSARKPKDKLDEAFLEHDEALRIASLESNREKREKMREEADKVLAKRLRGDLGRLSLWGRVYCYLAKWAFRE